MKIQVIAHTGSKYPRIEEKDNIWHVHVKEKAIDGQANRAIINSLAEFFDIKRNRLFIKSGEKSKIKIIEMI